MTLRRQLAVDLFSGCGGLTLGLKRAGYSVVGAVEVDELERAVRNLSQTQKASLALQADRKASFGTIIKVMDALKLAGVRNLPAFTRGE